MNFDAFEAMYQKLWALIYAILEKFDIVLDNGIEE